MGVAISLEASCSFLLFVCFYPIMRIFQFLLTLLVTSNMGLNYTY